MLHTLSTLIFFQLLAEVLEAGAGVVTKAPRVLGVPRERLPMAPLTTPSDTTSNLPHPQPRLRDTSGLLKNFVQCKNRMHSYHYMEQEHHLLSLLVKDIIFFTKSRLCSIGFMIIESFQTKYF